ncbi:MAG: hypothetical protein IPJ99_00415 [Betaproteobacteria bacterium]|nr:hypothetical protein [Betaproteobacteria bacterium]
MLRDLARHLLPVRYSPGSGVPSSRRPRMVNLERGESRNGKCRFGPDSSCQAAILALRGCAFFLGDFVIGHQNALPLAAISGVEQVDRVKRRPTAGEKIRQQCIGLIAHHSGDGIANGVDGFREGKFRFPAKN